MTAPVDPIRRSQQPRTPGRRASDRGATGHNLPARIEGQAEEPAAPPPPRPGPAAGAFAAQLLGQEGQRRGLRGGEPVLNAARTAYVSAEWSGKGDRRTRKGRVARTEI